VNREAELKRPSRVARSDFEATISYQMESLAESNGKASKQNPHTSFYSGCNQKPARCASLFAKRQHSRQSQTENDTSPAEQQNIETSQRPGIIVCKHDCHRALEVA